MDFICYSKAEFLFLGTKAMWFPVCCLSELRDKVATRYLTSTFFGHISADHLLEIVMDILESSNVSTGCPANLSTDGSNINKGLHQMLNQKLYRGLLPFNLCVLYKFLTSFQKGPLKYRKEVENLFFNPLKAIGNLICHIFDLQNYCNIFSFSG